MSHGGVKIVAKKNKFENPKSGSFFCNEKMGGRDFKKNSKSSKRFSGHNSGPRASQKVKSNGFGGASSPKWAGDT